MNPSAITNLDKKIDPLIMNTRFEAATFEPETNFEKNINEIKDNHLENIAPAATNPSAIASSDENFDPLCINNSFKAEKFEPEPTFENTINEIKANHSKSITSIDMNVSPITYNKPYLSSEHLKYDIMPWIILQSPEKSPQFTNHLSSIYPNGNTQL